MQITEALLSAPGEIRRFVQQGVDHWPHLLAFHFTLHSAEGNINGQHIHAFCTSFMNVLLSVITRPVHHRRWYYAGCGNNMEEQQCDACCCSARRVFVTREPVSQLMNNVRKWWIYCSRPGGGWIRADNVGWKGVFGLPGLIHQSNTLR